MKSSGTCVMLRVSEPWQSVARYSGPLNRDLLLSTSHSFLPSFHSPTLLHLTQLSNPLSHFLSFFSSSRQAFVLLCRSDTFLKHGEHREKQNRRGWRGRWNKRKRVRGAKLARGRRNKSAGHFLSYCRGEEDGESESAGRSKANTGWQRWRGRDAAQGNDRLKHSSLISVSLATLSPGKYPQTPNPEPGPCLLLLFKRRSLMSDHDNFPRDSCAGWDGTKSLSVCVA